MTGHKCDRHRETVKVTEGTKETEKDGERKYQRLHREQESDCQLMKRQEDTDRQEVQENTGCKGLYFRLISKD